MNERPTNGTGAHRLPPPPPRRRPRRRHPAARSRLVTGAISVVAFLGLGGTMAAHAAQTAATGQERATRSTTSDDTATDEDDGTRFPVSVAQPAAPVLGRSPTSTSSGS